MRHSASGKLRIMMVVIVVLFSQMMVSAKERTSDTMINRALEDQRSQKFLTKNQSQLYLLKTQQDEIVYTLESYEEYPYQFESENERMTGVFPQMILFFKELTCINFQKDTTTLTKDEMISKLIAGEIDWIPGLTLSEQTVNKIQHQNQSINIIPLQGELFYDPLILMAKIQDQAYTSQTIPYYYWGCLEEQKEEIIGSELDEHTVTYNTFDELEDAFTKAEIQGILLPRGRERYLNQRTMKEYQIVDELILPARKYCLTVKDQEVLQELLPKMIQLYLTLYDDYFKSEITQPLTIDSSEDEQEYKGARLILLGGMVLILLGFVLHSYRFYQKNKKIQLLFRLIPQKIKQEQDVLIVNMDRLTISSKHHFQVFGMSKKQMKTMQLNELTKRLGFDFAKHYAYIIRRQDKIFTCYFELYMKGVSYKFEEVVAFQDNLIVSKLYREEK